MQRIMCGVLSVALCAGMVQTMDAKKVEIRFRQQDPKAKYEYRVVADKNVDTPEKAEKLKFTRIYDKTMLPFDDKKSWYLYVRKYMPETPDERLPKWLDLRNRTSGVEIAAKMKNDNNVIYIDDYGFLSFKPNF